MLAQIVRFALALMAAVVAAAISLGLVGSIPTSYGKELIHPLLFVGVPGSAGLAAALCLSFTRFKAKSERLE